MEISTQLAENFSLSTSLFLKGWSKMPMRLGQELWIGVQRRHLVSCPALGQEDLLEEGMAIHASILAWRIPWTCSAVDTHETIHVSPLTQATWSSAHSWGPFMVLPPPVSLNKHTPCSKEPACPWIQPKYDLLMISPLGEVRVPSSGIHYIFQDYL